MRFAGAPLRPLLSDLLAALAVVNNSVICQPVNCAVVYGALRPVFNPITGLCVAQPSASPSPSHGASPSNGTGSGDTTLVCVHGTIVCGTSCTCACADGWTTTVDAASVFALVYCNASSGGAGGGIVGQASSGISCNNAIECFFVDELPYALVGAGVGWAGVSRVVIPPTASLRLGAPGRHRDHASRFDVLHLHRIQVLLSEAVDARSPGGSLLWCVLLALAREGGELRGGGSHSPPAPPPRSSPRSTRPPA